jgi:hypothetical protein
VSQGIDNVRNDLERFEALGSRLAIQHSIDGTPRIASEILDTAMTAGQVVGEQLVKGRPPLLVVADGDIGGRGRRPGRGPWLEARGALVVSGPGTAHREGALLKRRGGMNNFAASR